MTVFIYVCPECGVKLSDSTLKHQHSNGEWIETSTVKAYFLHDRWSKLHLTWAKAPQPEVKDG